MNTRNGTSIGDTPTFMTVETKQKFLKEQLDLYKEIKNGDKTWADMNRFRMENYGFVDTNTDSLRRSFTQLKDYLDNGWINLPTTAEAALANASDKEELTIDYDKGTTTSSKIIELTEAEAKDPSALLKAHNFDPSAWDIKSANIAKTQRANPRGSAQSYSSRIVVKPKKELYSAIPEIKEYFKDFKPIAPKLSFAKNPTDEYLVLPLYDFHWGRLPDREDAETYTLEETKQLLLANMKTYIEKFKKRTFKEIVLVVGQDFLNSSFTGYTSSQSHMQSNAVDFRTMFRTGSELLIEIINMFAAIGSKVRVIGSLGNHDVAEEVALFHLLSAYYHTISNVEIDDGTSPRKYIKLGNACIGFGHLDKEAKRAYGLMQCEAKQMWAETESHLFIAGHLHHFSVSSEQGVDIWRVPSPTMPDRWTVENGYVQNIPKTMAFIFNEDQGLIENHFVNI